MSSKHIRRGVRKPPCNCRKNSPEARHLIAALTSACEREPHVAQFVREAAENNAQRLIGDYHAHGGIMIFEPPWLLGAARAFVHALRETR